jgi:MFS transporter, ACS family, tartrate transporter
MTLRPVAEKSPLDRARHKAYWRLMPILFLAYVIAFVDRANVAFASLTMSEDLPGFDNSVIGFGAGIFFIGYFLLEIPGSLIVERWSARLWIARIMITWGFMAALTAFIGHHLGVSTWFVGVFNSAFNAKLGVTEFQFYAVRFLLGLAEAGFFPGVVVFLSHWFPAQDRARALALFFMATPIAQMIGPVLSGYLVKYGSDIKVNGVVVGQHPHLWGLEGWQWVYLVWGLPAVLLGVVILFMLPDKPRQARWLSEDERVALEEELARAKAKAKSHMSLWEGLRHPKVVALSFAYFCTVTGSYGIVFFMPKILKDWYPLSYGQLGWLSTLPALVALGGQLFVGWSSDRMKERRWHTVTPILIGAAAIAIAPSTKGNLWMSVACFMLALGGLKAYLPAFWTMPYLFLASSAAAASIGMINSVGNLGGQLGPWVIGKVQVVTGSFSGGLYFLACSMMVTATIVFFLGLGHKETKPNASLPPNKPVKV